MKLSLRQAAVETGKSKSTILRSIQSGRLSAERLDDGGYGIDPAELFRVYDPRNDARPAAEGQDATVQTVNENALLQTQLDALRETVRRLDDQLSDVREDRDRWRASAETSQRLLTVEREKPIVAPATVQPASIVEAPTNAATKPGLAARLLAALKG